MILILFGKPGSGKGTLSKEFEKHENVFHISTGDIFRNEIEAKTKLGILADSYISKGQLCPDDVTCEIIKNILINNKDKSIIFDGFPRTVKQADALNEMLDELNLKLDACINLVVNDEEVIERLSSRLQCKSCGEIYNRRNHMPKVGLICDKCGNMLYQRDDDNIESIKARLSVYENKTKPLIDYYVTKGKLVEMDGLLDSYKLYNAVKSSITANNTSSSL